MAKDINIRASGRVPETPRDAAGPVTRDFQVVTLLLLCNSAALHLDHPHSLPWDLFGLSSTLGHVTLLSTQSGARA